MVTVTSMIRGALVVGVLIVGFGAMAAMAQEARPAPDLRMLLNQPLKGAPVSPPPPDLRDLPQAKLDRPSTAPPITVIIADPHCDPAADGLVDPRQRSSRSRRSR